MASTADQVAQVSVSRNTLADWALGQVETLQVTGPRAPKPRSESYSPDFQICLPYRGAFVWHVGADDVVADLNCVLFVRGDEGYRVSCPLAGGYAETIVTVVPELLAELLGVSTARLGTHPTFQGRSRAASAHLQRLGCELVHRLAHDPLGLDGEESLVDFVREALRAPVPCGTTSPSTRRLVGRAKAYLAANLSSPVRLHHVAAAAGTTPAYLTTVFRMTEGQPLHRYLVQLRLARALMELPHTADLTTLATDLGFASHSHFTAVFRRTFGCTPSMFRDGLRGDGRPLLARPGQSLALGRSTGDDSGMAGLTVG